jgi:hypothetical protein
MVDVDLGADLPSSAILIELDETWSVVGEGAEYYDLHGVLRRRPDGGIDFMETVWQFGGVAVREGRVPVRQYRADSSWRPRRRGRWLVFATVHGPGVVVTAFEGPEADRHSWQRDDLWPDPYRADARWLARSMRSNTASHPEQLAACGYERVAGGPDERYEIWGNAESPGLPMVCRSGQSWSWLHNPGELWQWDATPTVPSSVPDPKSLRRWAPEVEEWRIPAGPVGPFRGESADLLAYHHLRPERGGRLGTEFHSWDHPNPHFHAGPYMIATERECEWVDKNNRNWEGSLTTLKWRKTGEWGVEPD